MATPTTSGQVTFLADDPSPTILFSGSTSIDALLYGSKWGGVAGSGAAIDWSFPTSFSASYWGSDYDPNSQGSEIYSGWHPTALTSTQQTGFVDALQQWSNVANITFVQTVDDSSTVGNIRVAYTDLVDIEGAAAWAYLPDGTAVGGDVWLSPTAVIDFSPGSYDYMAAMHELGHALGLKHPFDTDNWLTNTGAPRLPAALDVWTYTIMSYSGVAGRQESGYGFYPTTPMAGDIAAMQYLYGANTSYHDGDDNYTFSGSGQYLQTIWDGGGNDTITYDAASDGAFLDLTPGAWSNVGIDDTGFYYDNRGKIHEITFGNVVDIYQTVVIENAAGGGGADTIVGNDAANQLLGNAGNDSLVGGLGDDTLFGGDGNDRIVGMQGWDTILGGNGDDVLAGGNGSDSLMGDAGNDTLSGVYGDDTLQGGAGNDWLDGFDSADSLLGGADQDTLAGGNDADWLDGGDGNDSLIGGAGDDSMAGLAGDDAYVVDSNGDSIFEAPDAGNDIVFADIGLVYASYTLPDNIETLILDDSVLNGTGNALDNRIVGGMNNNLLQGLDGNDTLLGGDANDVLLGDGIDTLAGGAGNDWLVGYGFADRLEGGLGDDTYETRLVMASAFSLDEAGAPGNSILDGTTLHYDPSDGFRVFAELYVSDSGILPDRLLVLISTEGIGVWAMNLQKPNTVADLETDVEYTAANAGGRPPTQTGIAWLDIDNPISSSATGHFTLNDLQYVPLLQGGQLISLDLEFDYLINGDEVPLTGRLLIGGPGPALGDKIVEAADGGTDTLVAFADASITGSLDLASMNIENVTLTGTGSAGVTGSDADNALGGNAGNNVLDGGAGNDSMSGGAGNDWLDGGDQNDSLAGDLGADTLDGGNGDDVLHGANGPDSLVGGEGNDSLYGENGTDTLAGGNGADWIEGGDGNDSIVGMQGWDTIAGGNGEDFLAGGTGVDSLMGAAGNDTLMGVYGNDTLAGGDGNDWLEGFDGADRLLGGADRDTLAGGNEADWLDGGEGNDSIVGMQGWDTIAGGNGEDSLFGGNGFDSIGGDAGDDFVNGVYGNDALAGGTGADTLQGGPGSDSMDAGADDGAIDTFLYTAAALNSDDVLAGNADIVNNAETSDVLHINTALAAALLDSAGNALNAETIVANMSANWDTDAGKFAGSANIGFDLANEMLKIDLDGNHLFDATLDYSITLVGINTVNFDHATDNFMLG